ncbi:MAG: aminoglycoside phosphotransferase [Hyphomonadaceae bacterium]|nr:MAG: aminoglycoside phosphotransferase [Hyphomonadaceae bacterium]KAF0186330.1 MAG: aminoglycoside phosphotransferase [Hyphomonadaceae bacterium]
MTTNPNLDADNGLATPCADTEVSTRVLHQLLKQQFPEYADLPLKLVASGWDNCMILIGDELCARMPRRKVANQLILNEQKWLPILAPHLTLEIPTPLHIGCPSENYPYDWSIVKWLAGNQACDDFMDDDQSEALIGFLKSLHFEAPSDAPISDCRGIALSERAQMMENRLARLAISNSQLFNQLHPIWRYALNAPIDTAPTWLHGDLHPRNVLVKNGKITAAIDWGDMCAGDIATDLAAIWFLLNGNQARQQAIALYGMSQATIARSKGWALSMGLIFMETGANDSPLNHKIGKQIIANILNQ